MADSSKLFQPLKVGNNQLQHRLAMAPLTRFRADGDHVPLPMVKEYYEQRASVPGTLLITEATFISPQAGGYPNCRAWKDVTDAVHAKGSFIWVQLWALGRVANPDVLKKENAEFKVKGASPLPEAEGKTVPAEMTEQEIQEFVRDYAQAARNAVELAGFDGVEIHGANGYLVDQFLQDVTNRRTDCYGGSIENRSRFALEVAKAVVEAPGVGPERVGIRLSPWSPFQGMKMADPVPQFTHVINGLKQLKLAYLHVVESRVGGNLDVPEENVAERVEFAVEAWANTSPVFIAGGFTPASARKVVDEEHPGRDVVVVFGRYFISTPDLPFRIREGIELAPYDRDTFYNAGEEKGYLTYPFSEEFLQSQKAAA
ncbi:Chanoclavine-I aldehyde reductase [Apiospora phragmitis]|uniref:Chanoclavine-I aldehyde reductase n=1 Tax=Apiospora phragmitis TaxID=2905665 RepID=A0ABR1WR46_9PEZI